MGYFYKEVAKLKKICDSFGYYEGTQEGEILNKIVDILDNMSRAMDTILEYEHSKNSYSATEHTFVCPSCSEEIEVSEYFIQVEEEIICPICGEVIPISSGKSDDES